MTKRTIRAGTAFALLALVAASAVGQRSIPLTLEQMVRTAGVIVHARVVATETGKDPRTGLPATWTTLEVRENFYGASSSTVRYKQFGGEADGFVTPTPDIPRLSAGNEVILLLSAPSKRSGFQSPVGMAQGVFRVSGPSGGKRVTQSVRMTGLMKTGSRAPLAPDRDGTIDLQAFTQALRTIVREVKP